MSKCFSWWWYFTEFLHYLESNMKNTRLNRASNFQYFLPLIHHVPQWLRTLLYSNLETFIKTLTPPPSFYIQCINSPFFWHRKSAGDCFFLCNAAMLFCLVCLNSTWQFDNTGSWTAVDYKRLLFLLDTHKENILFESKMFTTVNVSNLKISNMKICFFFKFPENNYRMFKACFVFLTNDVCTLYKHKCELL